MINIHKGLEQTLMEENMFHNPIVAWITEATMDYKIEVTDQELNNITQEYLKRGHINENNIKTFKEIIEKGLNSDIELSLDGKIIQDEVKNFRNGPRTDLNLSNSHVVKTELGGSPAISARAGYHAYKEFGNARTIYCGSRPNSIEEFIKEKNLEDLFRHSVPNDYKPSTLCLENGKYKLMLSDKKGRELKNLKLNDKFNIHIPDDEGTLVAIGGLNKGEPKDYHSLIDYIKSKNPNAGIFIGTNSFSKYITNNEFPKLNGYFDVARRADILSINEAEEDQLHQGLKMCNENKSRTEKLEDMNFEGLVVVHSHAGIKLYLGTSINLEFKGEIKKLVKLACYATTYYIEHGEHVKNMQELNQYYDDKIHVNNSMEYNAVFGNQKDSKRTTSITATYLPPNKRKGNITGAGAIFDGYLCSFLSPYIQSMKNGK
ncbi:MAG: hypothetical protein WC867_01100 [Candidatus Pacearchaeota archaeon]|jgi:hypothetical protein